MKAWFQRFMSGRYGVDPFSQFLSTAALILVILGLFLPGPLRLLGWLGWAALIYSYYRIFSRNIPKRAAEKPLVPGAALRGAAAFCQRADPVCTAQGLPLFPLPALPPAAAGAARARAHFDHLPQMRDQFY